MQPNFLVIGVAKGGTTSLYHYLRQHPDIFLSALKEVNYFAYEGVPGERFPVTTWEGYLALFAAAGGARAVGESSPSYLSTPGAAARIRERLPEVRLVASLRNPADRAWSGWLMRRRHGRDARPAEAAFGPEEPHVRLGFYHQRLLPYFERFDADRIQVCLFEDLARDPVGVCRQMFAFLGVDSGFAPDVSERHNPGGVPRSPWLHRAVSSSALAWRIRGIAPAGLRRLVRRVRDAALAPAPPIPPELRARLLALYRDDVARLEDRLRRDLSVWSA
jgi:hypothetical protein